MAVTFKKLPAKVTSSMSGLLSQFQHDMGEGIGNFGGAHAQADRIPTGVFALDLAMGGGFPRGKCSIVFGPESSGKTNLVYLAIASHQKLWPDLTCAFVDVEHAFDPDWFLALGGDPDKLLVISPAYAEQAVDIVESLLRAEDCGIVAIDSLAALVTSSEMESSAEKAVVGGAALVIGKLYRKTTIAMVEAEKAGRFPTLIYVNQITYKIGVMFGDPETTPGGTKPRHQSSMTLRLYGKNKLDPKVSATMPVFKETKFVIKKWKVPILHASGEYDMVTYDHDGFHPGQCADFTAVVEYLKTFGEFGKHEKKGWQILDAHYATIEVFKTRYYEEPGFGQKVRQHIVTIMLNKGELLQDGGKA